MYILGISAYYHDSAATLIKDGKVIFAVEEEGFSRIKHDNSFPFKAIRACLAFAEVSIDQIDYISYYEKPLLKFERILETFVKTYPYGARAFVKSIPDWMNHKIKVEQPLRKKLKFKKDLFFIPHHLSHASSVFYPSPFESSAIATIDGVGEYQTTALWEGKNNAILPLKTINFPHSLGLLYSTFTSFLGYKVNNDEYKVMGLSAYGNPNFINKIFKVIDIKDDGSFRLNMNYFSFQEKFVMWSKKFTKLFGSPRKPEDQITQKHMDIASSIQLVTEKIYLKILNHLYSLTKNENVCVSGGVGLNALGNGKIFKNTPFKKVYIMGAAGDSGNAIGAALYIYHSILNNPKRYRISHLNFGNSYKASELLPLVRNKSFHFQKYKSQKELLNKVVDILIKEGIVGWFQGRMEFSPRALGNRSILASPKNKNMKERVNEIKKREDFRPFGGSVLEEHANKLFDLPLSQTSFPYMNFCFQVKKDWKDKIPSIIHKDNSCRIQTINHTDGIYYDLIKLFYQKTKIPCLLNTSFNLSDEPLVESPKQAVEDFLKTKMKYLVIENYVLTKSQ